MLFSMANLIGVVVLYIFVIDLEITLQNDQLNRTFLVIVPKKIFSDIVKKYWLHKVKISAFLIKLFPKKIHIIAQIRGNHRLIVVGQ